MNDTTIPQSHITLYKTAFVIFYGVPSIARAPLPTPLSNRSNLSNWTNNQIVQPSARPKSHILRRRHPRSIRNLGLHVRNHAQQILNHFVPRLAPGVLDLLHLLLGVLAGVLFRLLVAARVLFYSIVSPSISWCACYERRCVVIERVLVGLGSGWGVIGEGHLLLEFLELVIFLLAVVFYFLLRFVLGVFDALRSV